MYLIGQDPGLHRWIVIHNLAHIFGACIEDANARYLAPIGDGTNYREHSLCAESEISASVFTDDAVRSSIMSVWADLQNNEGINSGGRQHLAHVLIGN